MKQLNEDLYTSPDTIRTEPRGVYIPYIQLGVNIEVSLTQGLKIHSLNVLGTKVGVLYTPPKGVF